MNAPRQNSDRFWTGLSFGVLLVFSAANLFILLFIVPKFGQIFADALPGKPLPPVTVLILTGRLFILVLNVALLILCAYLTYHRSRRSILVLNLATIWNFLQVGTTIIALFMPMAGTITGMAAAN